MKKIILISIAVIIAAGIMSGCSNGDGDKDYGYPYVMMPQAQRIEGYYKVPGGDDVRTYNFKVAEGKVKVFLGVLRSGKVADGAFSVDITTNKTKAEDFIYDGIVPDSELMPLSLYTMPTRIDVPGDSDQASFYLELNVSQLNDAQYDGKNLVLCVELANPTKFKLSRDSYFTVVSVDVDALRAIIN